MNARDIRFRRIISLRGPNIWTYRPAVEVWVDIGAFEDFPSNTLPGFVDRLVAWLPGLAEHRCGIGEPGGFLQRLSEGTWLGHILEHVTLELQNLIGMRTGFGKARETSERGLYKVVVRSRDEKTTRACLETARVLLLAAIEDQPFDLASQLAPLRELADSQFLGPSTACIVDGASERRIPSIRLSEGNLVQLGHGAKSHRIWTAETDRTSAIAESICSDKDLTKTLLQSCGIPVPEGRPASSAEDAWDAAQDIGLPVVVKPADANHGRGVYVDLSTEEDVKVSYSRALRHSRHVIVERFVPGNEHRLLVVGKKVVAAARGESAWITGDAQSTIAELIDSQINSDPRRGPTEDFPLSPISLYEDSSNSYDLARRGFSKDSIPSAGQRVLIQRNGNVAFEITDQLHPDVAATAVLAARVVGLDIAGIDLVAEDISRPLAEQKGAIVEVNAGPGLLMHLKPAAGEPRPVGRAIVDHLFPENESGRIPIVGITGSRGKTTVARLVARMLKLSGKHVGMACSDGLFFDRRRAQQGNNATWAAAHQVLLTRSVEAAVFENSRRTILSEGLAYDRCSVGIVTNVDAADLDPEFFIETTDQLANVFRTQVDLVLPDGVAILNASDPLVAEMADLCDGAVVFFGHDPDAAILLRHVAAGGRITTVRNGMITLSSSAGDMALASLQSVPLTSGGAPRYQIENILASVAAAWALGISHELIRAVIQTLEPGREEAIQASQGNHATR